MLKKRRVAALSLTHIARGPGANTLTYLNFIYFSATRSQFVPLFEEGLIFPEEHRQRLLKSGASPEHRFTADGQMRAILRQRTGDSRGRTVLRFAAFDGEARPESERKERLTL